MARLGGHTVEERWMENIAVVSPSLENLICTGPR